MGAGNSFFGGRRGGASAQVTTDPGTGNLIITGPLTAETISYRLDDGATWTDLDPATDLPADTGAPLVQIKVAWPPRVYQRPGYVPPAPRAETVLTDSITVDGVTVTLDRPMPVCFSCLGDAAIISTEAFQITAISPGTTTIGGYLGNGAMITPAFDQATGQGFDQILTAMAKTTFRTAYVAGQNVDPAASGPIAIAAGQETTIVKSVRRTAATVSSERVIERYVPITVLAAVPPAGFFRPAMAAVSKAVPDAWREGAARYGVLRSLPPVAGNINRAAAEVIMAHTGAWFKAAGAESHRALHVEPGGNYGADIGQSYGDVFAFLHSTASNADKRISFLRGIQFGIDQAGARTRGWPGPNGAGQGYGTQEFQYLAAFALADTALLASARATTGGSFSQNMWITPAHVGFPVNYPSSSGAKMRNRNTYLPSDVGIPDWSHQEGVKNTFPAPLDDAGWNGRYRRFFTCGMLSALCVELLQDGPGGITGTDAILAGGPNDVTNRHAAALNFYDRARTAPIGLVDTQARTTNGRQATCDAWRAHIARPAWTGRPEWLTASGRVTAGDGQIAYDWTPHQFSTLPITRRDVRYSMDPVTAPNAVGVAPSQAVGIGAAQFVQLDDVPASGVLTGLTRGLAHEVSYRIWNANGPGRWSSNWPMQGDYSGGDSQRRNSATPTGTAALAAPVFAVAPKLFTRTYPQYVGEIFTEIDGVIPAQAMAVDQAVLVGGVGYVTGYPAPTFAFEWEIDGVLQAGNARTFDAVGAAQWRALAGKSLTYRVTATNSQGSATATVTVAIPAEPVADVSGDFSAVRNWGRALVARRYGLKADAAGYRKGTVAFRGKIAAITGESILMSAGTGTSSDALRFYLGASGQIGVLMAGVRDSDASYGSILSWVVSSAQVYDPAVTETLVASWDLDAGIARCYRGDTQVWSRTPVGGRYNLNGGDQFFFSGLGQKRYNSDAPFLMSNTIPDYLYLAPDYVDLTVEANRLKFRTPAGMGAFGDGPTGQRPLLYLTGDAAAWNGSRANRADIGGYPPIYNLADPVTNPGEPEPPVLSEGDDTSD